MSQTDDLIKLFSEMSVTVTVFFAVGLMLLIIEFFQPTHFIAGGCGTALILSGIAVRMLTGGNLGMLLWMVFGVTATVLLSHSLMIYAQKRNWIRQGSYFTGKEIEERGDQAYSFLINHEGVATTDIIDSGHIAIDDINFLVTSTEVIHQGESVMVVEVDGDKIVVKKTD